MDVGDVATGEIMYSESHGHFHNLADDAIECALGEAAAKGVELVLTAGIDLASSQQAIALARRFQAMKACIGIHPWKADQYSDATLNKLRALARDLEVVAISEIGLDYVGRMNRDWIFVSDYVDPTIQRNAFIQQLRLAKALKLPVLVHDRTPEDEVFELLD
jgi:TatD DNase family protein